MTVGSEEDWRPVGFDESQISLLRQAHLLAQGLQPRIAAQKSQFRECQGSSEPNGSKYGHAIQGFQCALFVTQTGIDQNALEESPSFGGCKPLGFLAAAGPSIGVAQPAGKRCCRKNLNCLVNSPLA